MPPASLKKRARRRRQKGKKADKGVKEKNKSKELVLFRGTVKNSDSQYYFERRPFDLNSESIRGYGPLSNPLPNPGPFRPPIYAIAWGWNSGGRAGNVTEVNITIPRQVQRSISENYISVAAGKHHSLVVNDKGVVFSFGEGRKGQLGYGNPFTEEIIGKGGQTQSYPRQVTPSGIYKYGRDIKITQVACGSHFSVGMYFAPIYRFSTSIH